MRIAWIMGWAVPQAWFASLVTAVFPSAAHSFFLPSAGTLHDLASAGPFDWACGYSLGSHLLLANPPAASAAKRVALLAPIFSFPGEAGLGGRISRAEVKHLARLLRHDRASALAGFHRRAGLDVPPESLGMQDTPALLWGLERLENDLVNPPLPETWRAWCGADDALLDATRLREIDPGIAIVPGASHHPAGLLRAFAKENP